MIEAIISFLVGLSMAFTGAFSNAELTLGATPALTVPQGGTGWGNIQGGTLLYGTGSSLRVGTTSTTTLTENSSALSLSQPVTILGAVASVLSLDTSGFEVPLTFGDGLTRTANDVDCDTASGSVFGCLASADWTTFNSKESALTFSYPLSRSVNAISFTGLTTTTPWTTSNLAFVVNDNTVSSVATGTISVPTGLTITANRYAVGGSATIGLDTGYVIPLQSTLDAKALSATTITVAGTANQLTSSAGAQDLSANRTWTLSLPAHVIFPGNFFVNNSTTTNATSTNMDITSKLTFNGVTGTTWASFCTSITGGAGLCDGADATGSSAPSKFATSTQSYPSIYPNGNNGTGNVRIGVGTTTPRWSVQIASTTGAQLGMSNGSLTAPHWTMRAMTNGFAIATASPTTFATSTALLTYMNVDSSTGSTTFAYDLSSRGLRTTLAPTFDPLTSALILTGADGATAEYAGASCTNQFVRSLSALGASTCATVVGTDTNLEDLTAGNTSLTFSGTYDGQTARNIILNVGNANTWTALQTLTVGAGNPGLVSNSLVGIGTSTPKWALQVASSTGAQITVSDSGLLTSSHWSLRNDDGKLFIATSSPATYATSTRSGLIIDTDNRVTVEKLTVGALTGVVRATSGVISTGLVDLANDMTGILTVGFGGTGWANLQSGYILAGNGTNRLSTSTAAYLDTSYGAVGIGTTTPKWILTASTSTRPQLALTDGSNTSRAWTFRSINNYLYVASSTPTTFATSTFASLQITPGGLVSTYAVQPATSTAITVDWLDTPNQVEYRIGGAATTITFINATTAPMWGSTKRVWVCNPSGTAGALTWAGVRWTGGTAPTQTTTADKCDMYSFNVTRATSSTTYILAGAATTNF